MTRAVLLAAGRGTRLGALTAHRPKPLIPIAGTPLIEHIIVGLARSGVTDCLCVVGYLGDLIVEHLGDGARLGVRIQYVRQPKPEGTGAALLLGREFAADGPVIMSYGDILTGYEHYVSLQAEWSRRSVAAVLGINPMDDVSAGAAIIRDGDRIVNIVEKPKPGDPTSTWNQAGVTAFGEDIWLTLERLPRSPRGEYELTGAVGLMIAGDLEVRAVEFNGFWSDVGTPEALADAERRWRSVQPFEGTRP